ncbi:MAG TPA: hypothetical protein VMK31_06750 [Sphingomicrobium sp.]|nr:hypothetical protein [Sphingomicrobium sp.]
MTKLLAFVAALLMSGIAVSSACVAGDVEPIAFTVEPGKDDRVKVTFRRADQERTNSWSNAFRPADLAGLDADALRSPDTRPIRFAIAREAGRVDCAGTGGNSLARGTCSLTPDARFNDFLARNGVARPSREQTFGLIALNVKRELVTALRAANYPAPSLDEMIGLTAVGVTNAYIGEMARAGYRPKSLDGLLQFRALNITPDYIGRFSRMGYGDIPPGDLIQLKALNVTPEYIASFERIGYGRLPVSSLVQMKALGVTPEFVRAVQQGDALPSPDRLVTLRALGRHKRQR